MDAHVFFTSSFYFELISSPHEPEKFYWSQVKTATILRSRSLQPADFILINALQKCCNLAPPRQKLKSFEIKKDIMFSIENTH
jgi:hypothetical protein